MNLRNQERWTPQQENHESVGIRCPLEESYKESGYCFIETTAPAIISDDSIEYDRLKMIGKEYKGFCNDQKVWGHVTTDQEGKFFLNVKNINITPPTAIMIDPGKEYYAIGISRSDTITHHYSPSHLRVMNQEKSGHVISNLLYDLDTKEVKELFTNGDPEKTHAFDVINLTVFRLPKN